MRRFPYPLAVRGCPTAPIAADAVGLVQVAYEPLPVVATPQAALAPGAPRLFAGWPNNVEHVWARRVGDPDGVFADAHRVVTLKMNNQRVAGVSLETRAVMTAPDPATHGLTAWTSNQGAHIVRDGLAATLRLPTNAVRVITPDVGGGFGIKINLYPEEVVLSALTLRDHVPHKWVETRSEHLLATTHGRGQTAELTAVVDARGEMQALRMRVIADIGAYANDAGVANLTGLMAAGPYKVQHLDLHIPCVFTNTTPVAAFRGAGRPEAFPYQSPSGYGYDSSEYEKALDHALVPQGNGTMGSRGPAVVRAADKVRAKALQIAAHMLEAAVDDLEFADGSYRVR
jgi:carbon-monoxide dehydrogenase large subunit